MSVWPETLVLVDVLFVSYPTFVSRTGFRPLESRRVAVDHVLFSVFMLLPLTLVAEVAIVLFVAAFDLVTGVSVAGWFLPDFDARFPFWNLVVLWPVTTFGFVLGMPLVVVVYSLTEPARPMD